MRNNFLKKYFTKHQKTSISLLCILLVFGGELLVNFVTKNVQIIEGNRDEVRVNNQEIESLERSVNSNKLVIQNIVTRQSFNAYIRRLDEERHSQVDINNNNNRDIGMLIGRLDSLEKIVYKAK